MAGASLRWQPLIRNPETKKKEFTTEITEEHRVRREFWEALHDDDGEGYGEDLQELH